MHTRIGRPGLLGLVGCAGLVLALTACGKRDSDGDGLSNKAERDLGTNPDLSDSDGDGLGDLFERLHGADPNNPDSGPATA